MSKSSAKEDESGWIALPQSVVEHLPEEWRAHVQDLHNEGASILNLVDDDLGHLNRLAHSMPIMTTLRYVHSRLSSLKFDQSIEWLLESEMLTTAFVTTYARLVNGGLGRGVSRKNLPRELRSAHDQIMELRNKRYAHNDQHDSLTGELNIQFDGKVFELEISFQAGVIVRGTPEWASLVRFLDALMVKRIQDHLKRLRKKTGRDWSFPSGPPPSWVSATSSDHSGESCSII